MADDSRQYTAAAIGAGTVGKAALRAMDASQRHELAAAVDLSVDALADAEKLYSGTGGGRNGRGLPPNGK